MRKDQTFQQFYAELLRLITVGNITLTPADLKAEIRHQLFIDLQEAVDTYYLDAEVTATQFARLCTSTDQLRHSRAEQRAKFNARTTTRPFNATSATGLRSNTTAVKPTASASTLPVATPAAAGTSTGQALQSRPLSTTLCHRCGRTGHVAATCRSTTTLAQSGAPSTSAKITIITEMEELEEEEYVSGSEVDESGNAEP
jgi:hypothetical protein